MERQRSRDLFCLLVGAVLFGSASWLIRLWKKRDRVLYVQDGALPFRFTSGVRDGFCGAIGNSPLIYIRSLSEETGCHIFGCT